MSKKLFVFFLVALLMFSLVPAAAIAKGPGGGGEPGGGGHTEPAGNNLSFPVIWSEGASLSLPGTPGAAAVLTVPYDVVDGKPVTRVCYTDEFGIQTLGYAYAQKTLGNVWQAENVYGDGPTTVNEIDWGDSLESVDMKVGRPVRVELSLYKLLATPMTGYRMTMLANPSSPDEVQGACSTGETPYDNGASALTYDSSEATVYTARAGLLIQLISGDATTLEWNGTQWTGAVGSPIPVIFSGELNVGGKVIYGLSTGGWRPNTTGVYRITFYMPVDGNTLFDASTIVRLSAETEVAAAEDEGDIGGGTAVVDWGNNLTYIDVTVVGGGGGGRP